MNNLPKPSPISAFAIFFCGCGYIWTLISFFQVAGGINRMLGANRVHGWAVLVPIYSNLHISDMANALNEVIDKEGLQCPRVQENMILNFLFPMITLFWLFQGNANVANALEAKGK